VADSAISVGIALLLLEVLLQKPQKDDEMKTAPVKP
jgi:hypothetical protein